MIFRHAPHNSCPPHPPIYLGKHSPSPLRYMLILQYCPLSRPFRRSNNSSVLSTHDKEKPDFPQNKMEKYVIDQFLPKFYRYFVALTVWRINGTSHTIFFEIDPTFFSPCISFCMQFPFVESYFENQKAYDIFVLKTSKIEIESSKQLARFFGNTLEISKTIIGKNITENWKEILKCKKCMKNRRKLFAQSFFGCPAWNVQSPDFVNLFCTHGI